MAERNSEASREDPVLQLQGLIRQQRRNIQTLIRHYESLRKCLDGERFNSKVLQNRFQIASKVWQLCVVTQTEICNRKYVEKENEYFINKEFEAAEEIFFTFNDEVMVSLQNLEEENRTQPTLESPQRGVGNPVNTSQHQMTSLPLISLPKFSGKPTDWATFRDYFISLIIKNPALDNLQRLHYLKSSIGGEAYSLIKNIPLTANNFEPAWDQLIRRYDNPRALINA